MPSNYHISQNYSKQYYEILKYEFRTGSREESFAKGHRSGPLWYNMVQWKSSNSKVVILLDSDYFISIQTFILKKNFLVFGSGRVVEGENE